MAGKAINAMKQPLRIRSTTYGDLPDLTVLYRHLYPRYPIFAEALADDAFQQALEEPGVTILAGFLDEQLVSACTLVVIPAATWVGKPTAMIENVVTHSDHRRRGFAGNVVSCAIRLAWRVGCAKVLVLAGFNDPAVSGLCAATGFELTRYGFELRRDAKPAGGVSVRDNEVHYGPPGDRSRKVHA